MSTIIAYVPALHRGYVDFFKKYRGGSLYILGAEFIREFPRMDRDIRALAPEETKRAVEALGIFSRVEVLTEGNIKDLLPELVEGGSCGSPSINSGHKNLVESQIFMPDEDISRHFAEKYLTGKNVEFVSVFLRWDKQISTKELEVPPDRVISEEALDKELMGLALKESEKSRDWWRQIGGVIVKNGEVLLAAHNKPLPSEHSAGAFGDPRSNFDAGQSIELSKAIHAEAALIAEAARRGLALEGASLYVTTFPCPICAKSIALSGIRRVYYKKGYSLLDAEDVLRAHRVEIVLVKSA